MLTTKVTKSTKNGERLKSRKLIKMNSVFVFLVDLVTLVVQIEFGA
jgi:hypothetical protein